jgi:protoheme IX farnesyltransferase
MWPTDASVERIYGTVGDSLNGLTDAVRRHSKYRVALRELEMEITATALSQPLAPAAAGLTTRLPDFIALMKPRVMLLAVFTALVGLLIAPGHLDPLLGTVAILAIAAGAGAAGVLNMWYDADIDAVMSRTAARPIPRRTVSRLEALAFGLVLSGGAVAVLGLALNLKAAALLAFTIFFYVVVYTIWLKRYTPQNIVIGGAAGALAPLIGWTAAAGDIGLEPIILFLIVFLWTPPHFWSLSLNRADDYARAGVPMLPVVAGRPTTKRQILIYSFVMVPVSMLPWGLGFAGTIYGAAAAVGGTIFLVLALQLAMSSESDRRTAHRLFGYSIVYLFMLFAALLASNGGAPSSLPSARAVPSAAGSVEDRSRPRSIRAVSSPVSTGVDEA